MNSNEYYEGYHSFKAGYKVEECPYRFEPQSAKEWKRGYSKAQVEHKNK